MAYEEGGPGWGWRCADSGVASASIASLSSTSSALFGSHAKVANWFVESILGIFFGVYESSFLTTFWEGETNIAGEWAEVEVKFASYFGNC